jgi:hypothetical protein
VAAELRLPENQQRHCLKIAAGIMHVSPYDCKRKMRVDAGAPTADARACSVATAWALAFDPPSGEVHNPPRDIATHRRACHFRNASART